MFDWFWQESLWLPAGVTWEAMKSNSTFRYPDAGELKYTFYGGFILLFIRILFESFVILPIGWTFGWVHGPLLGNIYGHLTGGFFGKKKFKRVAECAWRFSFYLFAWISGYFLLRDSPQLQDVTQCWVNWPHHHISEGVWWYYMTETSFYWALLIGTWLIDVRRADFWQMMIHHAITICLLSISWSMNMVRVGTLILFSHDAADIFIDLGKLVRYAHWKMTLNIVFIVFFTVWVATRLVYYPGWVIYSIWFEAPDLIEKSYKWGNITQRPHIPRVLMVMLTSLLVLHIFWTYVLLKIAYLSTKSGEIDDVREDDDFEDSDEDVKKQQ